MLLAAEVARTADTVTARASSSALLGEASAAFARLAAMAQHDYSGTAHTVLYERATDLLQPRPEEAMASGTSRDSHRYDGLTTEAFGEGRDSQ